jgi:hypothetical protein
VSTENADPAAVDPARRRAAAVAATGWCLRNGERMAAQGKIEQAAEWAAFAASTAISFGYSHLCIAPLEALLLRLGAALRGGARAAPRAAGARPARWLHVMSMTYPIGGHTAIVRRWIERRAPGERHDVVLTAQEVKDVAPRLAAVVAEAGGRIASLRGAGTTLRRAQALRALAAESADVVLLYGHPADVTPPLAFAAPGGPPVLTLDHSDHGFWPGVAAADIVIDIRDSGLYLTRALRGAARAVLLPVPVPDAGAAPGGRASAAARMRDPAALGREIVLLTIGGEAKYVPMPGLSFPEAALRIVREAPECAIVAVGPRPDAPQWQKLGADSGGRIVAVGADPDLAPWHAAADAYLEGYPRGSYTALLEVALAGRAFVRKPHLAPPAEFPIDRGSLAAFEPPATQDDYVAQAIALCRDPALRERLAARARADVLAAHCGAAWVAAREALVAQIPATHAPPPLGPVAPMTPGLQRYWDEYYRRMRGDPFDVAMKQAAARGLEALPLPKRES